jgi:RNA polymerase sigma factor (sigma-70 family)
MEQAMTEAVASGRAASLRRPARLLSDDRLMRLAADGDRRAFATIYRRHHQELYRYCLAILRSPEDATDALQSTMANALRSLPGERRQIPLKPWLFRVAHNEAVTILRQRRPAISLEDAREPQGPSANQQAEMRSRLRELVADLGSLPERQRGALVMRELSGLSYSEIGSAFGTSSAAAKQTVYEARAALHEIAGGRDMDCETVRQALSANDGRVLRGRKLRAHLRHCADCSDFRAGIGQRRSDLAALAPPLPALAAAGVLQSLAGAGGGGGSVGGGVLGLLGAGGGKTLATSGALKAGAALLATAAVGVGTAEVTGVAGDPFAGSSRSGAESQSSQGASSTTGPQGGSEAVANDRTGGAPGNAHGKPDKDGKSEHGQSQAATDPGHGHHPSLKSHGPSKGHSSAAHAAAPPKGAGGHAFGQQKAQSHTPQLPAQEKGHPAAPAHATKAAGKPEEKSGGSAPKAGGGQTNVPAAPSPPGQSEDKSKP